MVIPAGFELTRRFPRVSIALGASESYLGVVLKWLVNRSVILAKISSLFSFAWGGSRRTSRIRLFGFVLGLFFFLLMVLRAPDAPVITVQPFGHEGCQHLGDMTEATT